MLSGTYRHELKYQTDMSGYLALRSRVRAVMQPDTHAGADGRYIVHSIYFDNFSDKALREKLCGLPRREKFRIRYYNSDLSRLTLEKKMKVNNLCMKLSTPITESECRALLGGDTGWMAEHPSGLVRELGAKMRTELLRPKTLVSYVREPYVYAPGNVRVTFDLAVRSGMHSRDFLAPPSDGIRVQDSPGEVVTEIKYDAFLPGIIASLIQTEDLRQGAYSKYSACRRFG